MYCDGLRRGAILPRPSASGRTRDPATVTGGRRGSGVGACRLPLFVAVLVLVPGPATRPRSIVVHPFIQVTDSPMDAKQVWRAALGELQISLSPANFETWLRDTSLVDVEDHLFRIAVPNGFAKDWLETRYRSLISQTLARIVGYSVQVEFFISATEPTARA